MANEVDTRIFLQKIIENWQNHTGSTPQFSDIEDAKIMECLTLGLLNPEAFQGTSAGYWQNLKYPLTEKGKACIEEHFWSRLKRNGWLQMVIDIMAVAGFLIGVALTVLKLLEPSRR